MNYYVRMKIDNYILDRYGLEAQVHAMMRNGEERFYAFLSNGRDEDNDIFINENFQTFKEAHDFLVEKTKEEILPMMQLRVWKGKQASEDLEDINNEFNL
jgi:hypothetical protein